MQRNQYLDLLRFFAVALVLGAHFTAIPQDVPTVVREGLLAWKRGGGLGVMIFFTLSGYLVSGLIFRELKKYGSFSAGRFLFRRGMRIYPAFWLFLAVTMVGTYVLNRNVPWMEFLNEFFFIQNLRPGLWSHTWTLAIEEHFYLLLAISILVFADFRPAMGRWADPARFAVGAFCVLAVTSMLLRAGTTIFLPEYNSRTHIAPTFLILDAFGMGVLVNFLKHHRSDHPLLQFYRRLGVFRFVPLLAYVFRFVDLPHGPLMAAFKYPAIYLATSVLLLEMPTKPLKFGAGFAWLGKHSYSIYLWHQLINVWVADRYVTGKEQLAGWLVYVLVYFSLSLMIGAGLSVAVEGPLLAWRDRVSPSRSGASG